MHKPDIYIPEIDDAPLTREQEHRIRAIFREEIGAYFRDMSRTHGGGTMSYREYLATRDEPPAVPPMRVINTTERL